jgi:hypothetical protein
MIKACGTWLLRHIVLLPAQEISLLQGPLAAVASAPRRVPARSRVPANDDE